MEHFQANVKYYEQDEVGKIKAFRKSYLFEAEDYTDAEKKTYDSINMNGPDYEIESIKKMKLQEVFFLQTRADDLWFKAKVAYITFDEKTQKEKRMPYNMLINAMDVRDAYDELKRNLGPINDYEIDSVIKTNITEVILNEAA